MMWHIRTRSLHHSEVTAMGGDRSISSRASFSSAARQPSSRTNDGTFKSAASSARTRGPPASGAAPRRRRVGGCESANPKSGCRSRSSSIVVDAFEWSAEGFEMECHMCVSRARTKRMCSHSSKSAVIVRHLSSSLVISRHLSSSLVTSEWIVAQHGKERQREATRGNERQGEGGLIDYRSVEDLHPSPLTPRHRHGHRLRAAPCAMTIRTRSSRSRRERFRAFFASVTRAAKSRHVALRCSSLQSGKGWSRPVVRTRCS